jgi:hypothetical protein
LDQPPADFLSPCQPLPAIQMTCFLLHIVFMMPTFAKM